MQRSRKILSHNEMKKKINPSKQQPQNNRDVGISRQGHKTVVIATKTVITITLYVQKS